MSRKKCTVFQINKRIRKQLKKSTSIQITKRTSIQPKTYSAVMGFDFMLLSEIKNGMRIKGFKDYYINNNFLCIQNVSEEDVEKLKSVARTIKYIFPRKHIEKKCSGIFIVHYLNVFDEEKMKALIGVNKHRVRKPSANTTEKRIAARNARKEANKAAHVKFVKRTKIVSNYKI